MTGSEERMSVELDRLLAEQSQCFDLDDTTFDRKGRVCDWRNHVPEEIRDIWAVLTQRDRCLVAIVADHAASQEEWD